MHFYVVSNSHHDGYTKDNGANGIETHNCMERPHEMSILRQGRPGGPAARNRIPAGAGTGSGLVGAGRGAGKCAGSEACRKVGSFGRRNFIDMKVISMNKCCFMEIKHHLMEIISTYGNYQPSLKLQFLRGNLKIPLYQQHTTWVWDKTPCRTSWSQPTLSSSVLPVQISTCTVQSVLMARYIK